MFNGAACPDGTTALPGGYLLKIAQSPAMSGKPLRDQEDRVHQHTATVNLPLTAKKIASTGCTSGNTCNFQGASHETTTDRTAVTTLVPSGLSFIQILACQQE